MNNNKLIPINSSVALAKTAVALSLTEKLTFNQNRKMVKEIFLSNKKFFIIITSLYSSIDEELLVKYAVVWDWRLLSQNQNLAWSISLVKRNIDKWNWKELGKNKSLPWSESFIDEFIEKWELDELSKSELLPWSKNLIDKYSDKWNWPMLCSNQSLPWTSFL